MKETTTFTFFTIRFSHTTFPQSSNSKSKQHEQHNFENKDLENDGLEGQPHFSCLKHCLHKFVQCYRLQWFQCIHPMH